MESREFEGKTVQDAIEKACRELGVSESDLDIEIISRGYRGVLGLVGGKNAVIRVTLREKEETEEGETPEEGLSEEAKRARTVLEEILKRMMNSDVKISVREDDELIFLNIRCHDGGIMIGKNGHTLDSLQYLVSRIVHKGAAKGKKITLDIEGYRRKRERSLRELAARMGKKAKELHKPVSLEPMSPRDRRIVHLALRDDRDLITKSTGEGKDRRVVIYPKRPPHSR